MQEIELSPGWLEQEIARTSEEVSHWPKCFLNHERKGPPMTQPEDDAARLARK